MAVRRHGVDGPLIAADDAFADFEDVGDEFLIFEIKVVVDERVVFRVFQEKLHATLLMAPCAGGGQWHVTAVNRDSSDFREFAWLREAVHLWDFHGQMKRLRRIPWIAVVVTEEIVAVVGREAFPVERFGDFHGRFRGKDGAKETICHKKIAFKS